MAPNLKVDLEWLRKDARLWSGSADKLGEFASTAAGAKISSPFGQPSAGEMPYDPYALIKEFLTAYNKFSEAFSSRASKGREGMEAMSTTLVGVANAFHSTDTPR
ncbi:MULTISPECIES: hypothetical protein [Mycobacterium]|uniref:PE domain-containing protein n=1 Tax=Mycobacterium kiyosense TaxID=2871094 RepID=A0A9P3Q869_9MYCO|nr:MULTISPECIES: hypothetical protein [Mycobacterium]BDB43721.1 hypothetical protein IWGMT90018_41670 [Mycobacterium kiyosense]BDE15280.1 hypothetical protein MKCMC460_41400 [Mycobacterium sp. 20KCMC460]GLB84510.1 hypothetical protein SRL2020028_37660 [Mycobacterium kiyosense]GLB91871.1 hypothetical protein SRL2020130_46880 [Mycobacterium kiyosense]GLB97944.1 hypothetical protein SRL2020226_47200 [Mycobacterium kiyosense]